MHDIVIKTDRQGFLFEDKCAVFNYEAAFGPLKSTDETFFDLQRKHRTLFEKINIVKLYQMAGQ